jgi:hypothetical protein
MALAAVLAAAAAHARDLWSSETGESRVSLGTAFKATVLYSENTDAELLLPEKYSSTDLWRLRLSLDADLGGRAFAGLAYEHRARSTSDAASAGLTGAILPAEGPAPYRIRQLDRAISEEADGSFAWRHELDRAFVSFRPDWGEVSVGRQAVGMGRGVLFGAVDVFAPFTPLEVDREWRRGIDALRAEVRLTDTVSAGAVAAFGETWEDSALLVRARGYSRTVDGELIAGKRGEDTMLGGVCSAVVGQAEVHAELALFRTPEPQPDGGLFGERDLVAKAVVGTSYNFDVGRGLAVFLEYHYSGFGVEDIRDALPRLALDPAFRERFLRGDMTILGRHAAAVQASYSLTETWALSLLWLASPTDGSGVVAPSLTWDFASYGSFLASAYVGYGPEPSPTALLSEYGATPTSVFLQLRLYH